MATSRNSGKYNTRKTEAQRGRQMNFFRAMAQTQRHHWNPARCVCGPQMRTIRPHRISQTWWMWDDYENSDK
jgi:hypothetical protein